MARRAAETHVVAPSSLGPNWKRTEKKPKREPRPKAGRNWTRIIIAQLAQRRSFGLRLRLRLGFGCRCCETFVAAGAAAAARRLDRSALNAAHVAADQPPQ